MMISVTSRDFIRRYFGISISILTSVLDIARNAVVANARRSPPKFFQGSIPSIPLTEPKTFFINLFDQENVLVD